MNDIKDYEYSDTIQQIELRCVNPSFRMSHMQVNTPESVPDDLMNFLCSRTVEHLVLLTLDGQLYPINFSIINIGDNTESIISISSILRIVLLTHNCSSVIVYHNHPSIRKPIASSSDIQSAKTIYQALSLIHIDLKDFIIISSDQQITSFLRDKIPPFN